MTEPKKKIYIASSWKLEIFLISLAGELRNAGFLVDCFCDPTTGRYVFSWKEWGESPEKILKTYDAITALAKPQSQKAFREDKKWLDWCDICLLVLPSGNSAHLEAGYAKGRGKRMYIYGEIVKGKWDIMYGFADGIFRKRELNLLIKEMKK